MMALMWVLWWCFGGVVEGFGVGRGLSRGCGLKRMRPRSCVGRRCGVVCRGAEEEEDENAEKSGGMVGVGTPLWRPASLAETEAAALGSVEEAEAASLGGVEATVQERLALFWRLAIPYFRDAEGAKVQFGLLLALVLAQSSISVIFSYVGRDFYSALSAKDLPVFQEKTLYYALGLAVATPLTALSRAGHPWGRFLMFFRRLSE